MQLAASGRDRAETSDLGDLLGEFSDGHSQSRLGLLAIRPVRDAEPRLASRLPEQSEPHVASRPDRAPRPIVPGPLHGCSPSARAAQPHEIFVLDEQRRRTPKSEEKKSPRGEIFGTYDAIPRAEREADEAYERVAHPRPSPTRVLLCHLCTLVAPSRRPRVLARAPIDS